MNRTLLLLLGILPAGVLAQGTSNGASSLKLPQHALSASLSDVAVVEGGRLDAAGLNPAAIASTSPSIVVAFTHAAWVQDISGQRLSVSAPTRFGRFSAGAMTTRVPGIEVRDAPGPAVATFSSQSAAFQAGWAANITDGIVAGIAASYLYEKIYVNESTGFAFDAGVLATTPVPDLTVGISAVNLGGMSAFRNATTDLPSTLRLAAGYRMDFGEIVVRPAAAFRTGLNHEDTGVTLGGTVIYEGMLGIRASWRSGETARNLALGFTASYRGLGVEFAVVPFTSGLGTAQVLTFGLEF